MSLAGLPDELLLCVLRFVSDGTGSIDDLDVVNLTLLAAAVTSCALVKYVMLSGPIGVADRKRSTASNSCNTWRAD